MTADPALVESPTVELDDASKWFGEKVAVSNVTCSFGPGVTGLLGPNGAGKTTMLRMLTGLIRPSQGSVRVLGVWPRNSPSVYADVGLVPEEAAVYPTLTAREYVRYAATLSGIDDVEAATTRAIEAVALTEPADRPIGSLPATRRECGSGPRSPQRSSTIPRSSSSTNRSTGPIRCSASTSSICSGASGPKAER